ncbi:tyrosine-type recombinase/integrase [Sphingomonas sp. 1P08PE]|uniref:tyrosine-type recombinase/integrase n=1 Tax=Sphingomonas sp. 1P08PE TaxID=554122 RepID=UPI0039A383AB
MARLTAISIRNAKPGRYADGDGLYLLVKPGGSRSWLLRIQVDGRRRDIGLGSVELTPRSSDALIDIPLLHRRRLSLAEARDKCAILRKAAEAGLDPVLERDRDRRGIPTFEKVAEQAFEDLKSQWAPRQQEAYMSSLRRHAFPLLGKRRIDHITVADIQEALKPIWVEVPDMARKVRQRIGMVLNYAHAKGWRPMEAPVKSVSIGLAKRAKGGNYAAKPYAEVPAFVSSLQAAPESIGRLALLFTIYTAARSGETRHARWSHIDLERKLWVRPAELMKMRVAHTVTLSDAAVAILRRVEPLRQGADDLVFPGTKGQPLSDMTLSKIMRQAEQPYTVHGFRSSFRDWAAEKMSSIPDAVAEVALAHAVSDKVEAAYKRTDFIDMRRKLLFEWSTFIAAQS